MFQDRFNCNRRILEEVCESYLLTSLVSAGPMRRSRRCLAALLCSFPAARLLSPAQSLRTFAMTDAGASPMWESMWARGLRPKEAFDCGEASPTLTEVLRMKSLGDCAGKRALVPGCGRAYDAIALAEYGFDSVVAIDLAPTAVDAARDFLKASSSPAASKIEVACADFFKFELEPKADVIWDCTFLCALDPSVRTDWAKKMKALLNPSGTLLTCIFPICEKEGGPPFAMSVPLVRGLLEPEGFEAAEVREDAQKHTAGGGAFSANTALGRWILKS
ncbi:putative thiol methyltransferase 2 [Symbiodinium microadriaticum]|uniref:Putative thiol methyltransferase 2 n=1 Tax=Symbiodinium microadriaticum TaxID=2951 RepID=A0A1Q9F535_SYMMI|nr:putative thiol methyltransferase 2 [Symbiodinium microadriaticum]